MYAIRSYYGDTFYIVDSYGDAEWEYDDTQNRLLPEFETEVATTLQRDYYLGEATSRTFDHQIRPYVKYDWIPDVDQDELPQFDSVDEIDEVNAVTYGVDNFFNVFSTNKLGNEKQRQYSYLKLWHRITSYNVCYTKLLRQWSGHLFRHFDQSVCRGTELQPGR